MSKMAATNRTLFRFDPTDPQTRLFLRELDFSEREVQKGYLGERSFERRNFDPTALYAIASLDNSYERERFEPRPWRLNSGTTYISPREAAKGRQILRKIGAWRLQETIGFDPCWRPNLVELFRYQILRDKRFLTREGKPVPDLHTPSLARVSSCSYRTLPPNAEGGVFFRTNQLDLPSMEPIKEAAAAVHPIARGPNETDITGSAVRVRPDLYLTASSNLPLAEGGSIQKGIHVRFGAAALPIQVIPTSQRPKWVVVQVDEVPGQVIRIAGTAPRVGDAVFAISYPNLGDGSPKELLVSIGEIVAVRGDQIEHTALVHRGSAGGALVNQQGELVAIQTERRRRDSTGREFGPAGTNLQRWRYTGGVAELMTPFKTEIEGLTSVTPRRAE